MDGHPLGCLIGPLIAMAAFTGSVGNVPLAAVLWNGGISFGGVVAFVFGDLIIPPLLNIYRKYYGGKMTLFLGLSFYAVIVLAALAVEGIFMLVGWVLDARNATASVAHVSLNYATILDAVLALVAVALAILFARTGGPKMMRMMGGKGQHGGAEHHRE